MFIHEHNLYIAVPNNPRLLQKISYLSGEAMCGHVTQVDIQASLDGQYPSSSHFRLDSLCRVGGDEPHLYLFEPQGLWELSLTNYRWSHIVRTQMDAFRLPRAQLTNVHCTPSGRCILGAFEDDADGDQFLRLYSCHIGVPSLKDIVTDFLLGRLDQPKLNALLANERRLSRNLC